MPEKPQSNAAFISHAKADQKRAQEIAAALEERGLKCWIAPRDVRGGRSYGDEIIKGIEKSRGFVLVLSAASNESAFVAREVERAISKKRPVFTVRIENVEPSPALELFISGTQWIDAFSGRRATPMNRLAALLAEEPEAEPSQAAADEVRPAPRKLPRWALPAGALTALLVAIGLAIALRPGLPPTSEDASLLVDPVSLNKQDVKDRRQIAAGDTIEQATGRALGLGAAASTDDDFQACEKASGDAGIAACDRAIASGKFTGRNLSYLYNDRGFLRMQQGELDKALADLDEAIRIDASNLFAFWNRGAVYGARGDLERAREDFSEALALNPDTTTKAKIEEALAAINSSVAKNSDPSVISDPSAFSGQTEGLSAAAPIDAMQAAPPVAVMPAAPSLASPPTPLQIPVR